MDKLVCILCDIATINDETFVDAEQDTKQVFEDIRTRLALLNDSVEELSIMLMSYFSEKIPQAARKSLDTAKGIK